MIVRPVDFAVVQQMNEVSHIKQEEWKCKAFE